MGTVAVHLDGVAIAINAGISPDIEGGAVRADAGERKRRRLCGRRLLSADDPMDGVPLGTHALFVGPSISLAFLRTFVNFYHGPHRVSVSRHVAKRRLAQS